MNGARFTAMQDKAIMDRLMKVSAKLASLTMELNKTKIFGVKGPKYPSIEKMLSVGELESEFLL